MDTHTALGLIALNRRFYDMHASSFSATRETPWEGWKRVLLLAQNAGFLSRSRIEAKRCRILDIACGNLRFERFLADELPCEHFEFQALDSCEALTEPVRAHFSHLHVMHLDILDALRKHPHPLNSIPAADFTVCFGFMHHVPSCELRRALVQLVYEQTRPQGTIALSFWQFMNDEHLATKAQQMDLRAQKTLKGLGGRAPKLDYGDHFLGWQDDAAALRYCHHFTEAEIDELMGSLSGKICELDRFSADGKTGLLNRYVVFQRIH